MTVSKTKKLQRTFFTLGAVLWVVFVYIPSDLDFPWNVLKTLLGLCSPFFWYKALNTNNRADNREGGEFANAPIPGQGTATRRVIYLVIGAASWGIFVYNLPSHPPPPGIFFLPVHFVDPIIVRGILGIVCPFLLLAIVAFLSNENYFGRRRSRDAAGPTRRRGLQPSKGRIILTLALGFFAGAIWSEFVDSIPYVTHSLFLHFLHRIAGGFSPFLLIFALHLSFQYERELEADCCRDED